jgi:hypothetical protein
VGLACWCLALWCSEPPAFAADAADKKAENLSQRREKEVGKNEELGFQQEKVAAEMAELEERMFRLSEALKALEPENSSRLMVGLKFAREELIQHRMKEVRAALEKLKFGEAAGEQKELLARLQRLEQLLLSADLDFQMMLERLRLMREIMRKLDTTIKEEEREKSGSDTAAEIEKKLEQLRERRAALREIIKRQTGHIETGEKLTAKPEEAKADKPAGEEKPAAEEKPADAEKTAEDAPKTPGEQLAKEQQTTREQTKSLEEASEKIADAGKLMEQAQPPLDKQNPGEALPYQKQALEALKQAAAEMDAEEKKLEAALAQEKFEAMRKEQEQTRNTTNDISDSVRQLGDSGANALGELTRATGSMSKAEGSLGSKQAGAAGESQGEAVAALKYAREQLAEEAERLLNQLRAEVKKRVMEGLVTMLEGQINIRQSTERLGPRLKTGGRATLTAVVGLAKSEDKLIVIGEELASLVEETEFGIALPAALRAVVEAMIDVKDRLAQGDASDVTIAAEKQIEEDIQSLMEAMKQLPSSKSSGKPQPGNNAERQRELNRLIAELKLIRMLQVRVNRDTQGVDKERGDLKSASAAIVKRIQTLQGRQEDIHDVTERLGEERGNELRQ